MTATPCNIASRSRRRTTTTGQVSLTDSFTGQPTIANGGASLTFIPSESIANVGSTAATGSLSGSGITFTNIHASSGPVVVTYSARVATPSLFSGTTTISNTAQLSSGVASTATATIQGFATTTNVAVSKSVNDPAPVDGETITYTITLQNSGDPLASLNVRDTIGASSGVLHGNNGGTATFQGTQTVTAMQNGHAYTQSYTGSIGTLSGMTLQTVPSGAAITITYERACRPQASAAA